MTTIEEVYYQLTKEELGTERARIHTTFCIATLLGKDGDGGFILLNHNKNDYDCVLGSLEVNWVGNTQQGCSQTIEQCHTRWLYPHGGCKYCEYNQNKPKAKKLYAWLTILSAGRGKVVQYYSDIDPIQSDAIKLPEDQYPPIEVEE